MAEISLSRGLFTVVDDSDLVWLSAWKWHVRPDGRGKNYAARNRLAKEGPGPGCFYIHRVITEAPRGVEVDHINHDTLDNRRDNLRLATRQQNGRNLLPCKARTSSQFKGVTWRERQNKWESSIWVGRHRQQYLGIFDDEVTAALAYDAAARRYYGEFACTNFGGPSCPS